MMNSMQNRKITIAGRKPKASKKINYNCRSIEEFAAGLPEDLSKKERAEQIDLYMMKRSLKLKLGFNNTIETR